MRAIRRLYATWYWKRDASIPIILRKGPRSRREACGGFGWTRFIVLSQESSKPSASYAASCAACFLLTSGCLSFNFRLLIQKHVEPSHPTDAKAASRLMWSAFLTLLALGHFGSLCLNLAMCLAVGTHQIGNGNEARGSWLRVQALRSHVIYLSSKEGSAEDDEKRGCLRDLW